MASRADSSSSIIETSRFTDILTLSIASAAGCGAACPWRSRRNLLRCAKDGKLNWWIQLDFRFGRLKLCDIDGQLVREPHEIGQRFCLHFAHYLSTVDLDRDLAQLEFRGNLLVQFTGGDQHHDFPLARR